MSSYKTCSRCKKYLEIIHFINEDEKELKTCIYCRDQKTDCEYCGKTLSKRQIKEHKRKKHGENSDSESEPVDYIFPELTGEQNRIVNRVLQRQNVRVFAKAGTGKTTTALVLADKCYKKYNKKTLIVTYNRALCNDVRNKVGEREHIDVHTYHSLCGSLYRKTCRDDSAILTCIQTSLPNDCKWDLVIIDEAQDMKEVHFKLIERVLKKCKPTVLIMGDPFQRLYGSGAGAWYLKADEHFKHLIKGTFENLHLSISFRISHEMADYINTNLNPNVFAERLDLDEKLKKDISLWWGRGIHANPNRSADSGSLVIVSKQNLKNEVEKNYEIFSTSQSIVLATTCKNINSPAGDLAQRIDRKYGEPKVVDRETQCKFDKRMRHYATINQSKGLEYDFVCVPDMSNYWLDNKTNYNGDELRMYNLYYVALTRARKRLLVCEIYYPKVRPFCTYPNFNVTDNVNQKKSANSVTTLLEFVPVLNLDFYKVKKVSSIGEELEKNTYVIAQGKDYSVELSKFMGASIATMLSIRRGQFNKESYEGPKYPDIERWIEETSFDEPSWSTVVKFQVALEVFETGFQFLWTQITDELLDKYIDEDFMEKCIENTEEMLSKFNQIKYEFPISYETKMERYTNKYEPRIHGRCDFLADNSVIELKLSNNTLCLEHIEQCLLYASMFREQGRRLDTAYLYYPNKALLYRIKLTVPDKEYIDVILTRKCM